MVNMKSNNKSPIDRKQKRHDHGAWTLFFFYSYQNTQHILSADFVYLLLNLKLSTAFLCHFIGEEV